MVIDDDSAPSRFTVVLRSDGEVSEATLDEVRRTLAGLESATVETVERTEAFGLDRREAVILVVIAWAGGSAANMTSETVLRAVDRMLATNAATCSIAVDEILEDEGTDSGSEPPP